MKKVTYVASILVVTASSMFSQYCFADEAIVTANVDSSYTTNDNGQSTSDDGTVGCFYMPGWNC